ncbi:MAG TPA: indolepyruvate oxidoreductase subunit beta [Bellilinea sp.]|nr:indolepyruvate oxidoreductase subunit beta [Bellilinea sp.]
MKAEGINFALVGVGGQGTILASDVLAELGLKLGYDVKKAEVHGMSQRGGSVTSHLRWGARVYSPIIPRGEADVLVAFEKLEAARFIDSIKPGGLVLVNDYAIEPLSVQTTGVPYPGDEELRERLLQVTPHAYWVKGVEIAQSLGNTRAANVVLLGALSALLDLEESQWEAVLEMRVPAKHLKLNLKAFRAGREAVAAGVGARQDRDR